MNAAIDAEGATDQSFEQFVAVAGERLRRVLVAQFGVDVGNDVCADALAYAWEHWPRLQSMENPTGFLYRVAHSAARRHRRWRARPTFPVEHRDEATTELDTGLHIALGRLEHRQRTCVVLIHVYGWTYAETAEVLGASSDSVRNHLHRGMKRLRQLVEEQP